MQRFEHTKQCPTMYTFQAYLSTIEPPRAFHPIFFHQTLRPEGDHETEVKTIVASIVAR